MGHSSACHHATDTNEPAQGSERQDDWNIMQGYSIGPNSSLKQLSSTYHKNGISCAHRVQLISVNSYIMMTSETLRALPVKSKIISSSVLKMTPTFAFILICKCRYLI